MHSIEIKHTTTKYDLDKLFSKYVFHYRKCRNMQRQVPVKMTHEILERVKVCGKQLCNTKTYLF